MTDALPASLAAELNKLGIVLIIRKPKPVNRDARGWVPSATDKECPY